MGSCMPTRLPAGRAGLDFVPRGPYALGERVVRAAALDGSAAVLLLSVVDREAPDASLLSCGTPGNATARARRRRRSRSRAVALRSLPRVEIAGGACREALERLHVKNARGTEECP